MTLGDGDGCAFMIGPPGRAATAGGDGRAGSGLSRRAANPRA